MDLLEVVFVITVMALAASLGIAILKFRLSHHPGIATDASMPACRTSAGMVPDVGAADPVGGYEKAYGRLEAVARRQVLVQLDDPLVEALDAQALAAGVSRSELIRRAIADHLRDLEWAEHDARAVAAYRRRPEEWTGQGWPEE